MDKGEDKGQERSFFREKTRFCLLAWKLFLIFAELKLNPMSGRRIKVALMDEAREFISSLPEKAQKKITYNILRVEGGEISRELFKKLENSDIWEFRTLYNGTAYRLFAFWDTEAAALLIATHGIIKKTQKTPGREIAKAEALRNKYFNDKNKQLWKK